MRCEVWWARPVDGVAGLLDPDERARCARFRDRDALLRHVTGRALVRLRLGRELGVAPTGVRLTTSCSRCGCANGKPRLAEPRGVHFSVSHSGDRVVVAFAWGAEVGVDVEEVRPVDPRVAELAGCPAGPGFTLAWARKEAVLKATGHGLSVPPGAVRLSAPDEPPRLLGWSGPEPLGTPVTLRDLDAGPGYASSAALLTDRPWTPEPLDAMPLLLAHDDGTRCHVSG
ncbi:4'-phosphopantetheinyl transferase family protein [Saccharothrix lopnurensis]|uniref:4'-phosphopantetheinyl transferase family protein n=1 Tax=Saccharothrix lopnurensis TaxID=1670621 RepID=A0ABW1PAQ8_9PSEU